MERRNKIVSYNPLSTLCDTVPQFNRSIPTFTLKKTTGDLVHETYINGSIAKYKGRNYYAYRTDQKPFCTQPRIHLVEVDSGLVPISNSVTLQVKTNKQGWRVDYTGKCNEDFGQRAEDPRLCVVGDDLFIFWTDGFKMYYGQLDIVDLDGCVSDDANDRSYCKTTHLQAHIRKVHVPKPPLVVELFRDPKYDGREKNWTPFDRDGQLWIIYCFSPFVVCRLEDGMVTETVRHEGDIEWKHGFLKGGSPAILWNDTEYITIFHSNIRDAAGINYYYAGALTFDRETLKPTRISRYPIIAPYPDMDCHRPNTSYVVFPCGLMIQDDMLLISYGYNDHSVKVHAATRESIEYNLSAVSYRLNKNHTAQVTDNQVSQLADLEPVLSSPSSYHP